MRRILVIFLFFICLASASLAEGLEFTFVPDTIYPGKTDRVSFSIPEDAVVSLYLTTSEGVSVMAVRENLGVTAGTINLPVTLPADASPEPGSYLLVLMTDSAAASRPVTVGASQPVILSASLSAASVIQGEDWTMSYECSTAGMMTITYTDAAGNSGTICVFEADEGSNILSWDGRVNGTYIAGGSCTLTLTLTANGLTSESRRLTISFIVPTPVPTATPAPVIRASAKETETTGGDYWSMEIGNYDWDAIWQVLISDMTVISGKDQKATYKLRATPDDSTDRSNIVGEVTFESQGVHVLETLDNGWTYIETYNSSYGSKNTSNMRGRGYGSTDERIYGYVKTSLLKTFTPSTTYGILIDKLTQRLYLTKEGKLFTILLVSTGNPTSAQPWNETPSGEYYLCSKVGDLPSGNMTCAYGMRFNSGCILHEVPYIMNTTYNIKDYSSTEKYLGEKASHGCIRVQRKQNEDGINMYWIWQNVPLKTKLIIWDDSERPLPYPAEDDLILYYNPTGGKYYHADQNCASIRATYLPLKGSCTYAELDSAAYSYLTPCSKCDPPAKKSTIDAYNASIGY